MTRSPRPTMSADTQLVSRGTYVRHAMINPCNLLALGLIAIIGANVSSWMVVLLGLGAQLLVLTVLPSLGWFRRFVDERLALIAQQEAAVARAELLVKMAEDNRHELERLEVLTDRTRENLVVRHGDGIQPVIDDCFGLGRLVASYVKLAIAYKAGRDFFDTTSRQMLVDEIESLEASQPSLSKRMRVLAQRRLVIARKRLERWDRTRDDLEAISQQLATIKSLVHLVHELSMTPVDPDAMGEELDGYMNELDQNEGTMEELVQFAAADDVIDPQLLALGRSRATRQPSPTVSPPGPNLPRRW